MLFTRKLAKIVSSAPVYSIIVCVYGSSVKAELKQIKEESSYRYHGLGEVVLATKLVIDNMTVSEIRAEVIEAVKTAIDCSGKDINIELNF